MQNYVDVAAAVGATYGFLQGLAQLLMVVTPKNTVAFKVSKYLVSGPSRQDISQEK